MRIQNLLSPLLALCALAPTLAAQDAASPYRFVHKDACFVARMSGPAAWKDRFAGTQVAKLMKGPTLGPLLAEAEKAIDAGLEELRKKGEVDVDALRTMLTEYSGEMVVAMQVDFTDIGETMKNETPPKMALVFAFGPDGKTDFAPLLDALAKSAEEAVKGELRDLRVGDHLLRIAPADEGMEATLPHLIDGAVVMLVGNDLEQRAPKILGTEERWEAPATTADRSTFALHVAAEAGIDAMITAVAAQMEEEAPIDAKQLLTDLGLASVRSLDVSIGASGKYTDMAFTLKFNEKERGLFGMLAAAAGKPKLLGFVPPAADTLSVWPLDLGAFYRTFAKAWDAMTMAPMSREEGEAAFAERNKVRLKEDLFDHLGTEAFMVTDSKAQLAAMEDGDESAFAGTAGALALRDGKAFGDALEKVIRANGLHAGRKSEDYQGETVHRLNLFGVAQLEYCVAGDLLLVAGSDESSKKELRSILDERAARAAGKPQAEFPAGVKERLASLPGGWSGVSAQSMQTTLLSIAAAFERVLAMGHEAMPPPVAAGCKQAMAVMRKVAADLPAFGLDQIVATLHTSGDAWVSMSRW